MTRWILVALVAISCGSSPEPVSNTKKAAAEPYTVAVVYCGWEIWVGNDEHIPKDDPTRYVGVLRHIKAAFDKVNLARTTPPGSRGLVISYADKATIRYPLGPLDGLASSVFGSQRDYFGSTGLELVTGLRLAVAELAKVPSGRKVIIVLNDGSDTNNEAAPAALAELKKQAAQDRIDIVSIVYRTRVSIDANILSTLTQRSTISPTFDAFEADLVAALEQLGK